MIMTIETVGYRISLQHYLKNVTNSKEVSNVYKLNLGRVVCIKIGDINSDDPSQVEFKHN